MDKLKFLTITSITLVLVNLMLLGFIFLKPFGKKKHQGPKDYIVNKLNLNQQQIEQYDLLIADHQENRKRLNQQIQKKRQELYQLLLTNTLITTTNPIEELSLIQQELETLHVTHFKELKAICKEDQLDEFNSLVGELSNLFIKRHRKKL